jgi:hypothetical protein
MVEELEEEDYTCIFCQGKQAPDEAYKVDNGLLYLIQSTQHILGLQRK